MILAKYFSSMVQLAAREHSDVLVKVDEMGATNLGT